MGSMTVQQQYLEELEVLHTEAAGIRNRIVMDACVRASCALTADDAMILQQFIGQRIAQDRYGR